MKFKRIILIILAVIVLVAALIFVTSLQKARQMSVNGNSQVDTIIEHPNKIDYGMAVPQDFPTNIPVEEGVVVNQSYGLNYEGQKQLTIVFPSTRTVKENYALYSDFLTKQEWSISNKYENVNISSLYGVRESSDINITISEDTSITAIKSQVSISLLKK